MANSLWYRTVILELSRPLIIQSKKHGLRKWVFSASSPESIFSTSRGQCKSLLLVYRTPHPPVAFSILCHTVLLYILNTAHKDTDDLDCMFFFTYCIDSYIAFLLRFDTCEGLKRGLLAMAVGNGTTNASEVHGLLVVEMMRETRRRSTDTRRQTGAFVVDSDLSLTDADAARHETVLKKSEQITTFDEHTDGVV
jgi:hypothetical protein